MPFRKKITHSLATNTKLMRNLKYAKRTRSSLICLLSELVSKNQDLKRKRDKTTRQRVKIRNQILAWAEVKNRSAVLLSWLNPQQLQLKAKSLSVRSLLGLKMMSSTSTSMLKTRQKTKTTKELLKLTLTTTTRMTTRMYLSRTPRKSFSIYMPLKTTTYSK